MGRDYFGLINGRIPSTITDELPFVYVCCKFEGYIKRYEGCGCWVYDNDNCYIECLYNGTHRNITEDTSFAKWSIERSSITLLNKKIQYIKDVLNDTTNVHEIDRKIFMKDVMNQLIEAFNRYPYEDIITFTSETS